MLVTKKEPRLEKLPHRRGKCVSQQEGDRGAICSLSEKIPAPGQDLAWFCLGESQGLRKLLKHILGPKFLLSVMLYGSFH